MSFAFKRGVRAKKSQLGAKNVIKKLGYWKKNRGRNWAKLKNIYPCKNGPKMPEILLKIGSKLKFAIKGVLKRLLIKRFAIKGVLN